MTSKQVFNTLFMAQLDRAIFFIGREKDATAEPLHEEQERQAVTDHLLIVDQSHSATLVTLVHSLARHIGGANGAVIAKDHQREQHVFQRG